MDRLFEKAQAQGISPKALAGHLGITPLYLSLLSEGKRRVPGLQDTVLRPIADFLEISLAEVDHLAEKRTLEDFYYKGDLDERLERLHAAMKNDVVWGEFTPSVSEWKKLTLKVKVLIGTMYETYARTNLLPRPRLRPIVHDDD